MYLTSIFFTKINNFRNVFFYYKKINRSFIPSFKKLLDQRTKDLVANMLYEIHNLCRNKPDLANKILFDVHRSKTHNSFFTNLSNSNVSKKRKINNVYPSTADAKKIHQQNKKYDKKPRFEVANSSENMNESLKYSSSSSSASTCLTSSMSVCSSLQTTSSSPISSISSLFSTTHSSPLSSIKQNSNSFDKHVNTFILSFDSKL
jgi:hypothetical protein